MKKAPFPKLVTNMSDKEICEHITKILNTNVTLIGFDEKWQLVRKPDLGKKNYHQSESWS